MVSKFQLNPSKRIETKEVISRTFEIANSYAGQLSIEVIPLEKIELDPDNNRELSLTLNDAMHGLDVSDPLYEKKKADWKSLESLAKTILDDQLINPIYVYRFGNKCRLIAGERRTLASAIAGKKEIIARIANERPMGTKLRVLQWIENNERVDLSLAERIASLEAILKEHFIEHKDNPEQTRVTGKLISDLTGMSLTQSRRYLLILQAKPEIRSAIIEGQLENIKLIELICSIDNDEHQQEILQAAISGLTFESISKLKNQLETTRTHNKEVKRKIMNSSANLVRVKPSIAKKLLESLIASLHAESEMMHRLKEVSHKIEWGNNQSIEKAFRKIATLLEGDVLAHE